MTASHLRMASVTTWPCLRESSACLHCSYRPCAEGEYALLCELCWKEGVLWAKAGYPQMHGQAVIATIPRTAREAEAEPYTIAQGDVNAGVYTEGVQSLFS
jgi:hypothetical protein